MDPTYPLMGALVLLLVLIQLNQRLASPVIAIICRWMRWGVFSTSAAWTLIEFECTDRPYWAVLAACSLIWVLFETIYNWLMVNALSSSSVSMFPHYVINPAGDEWPVQRKYMQLRETLRFRGFLPTQALRAEIAGGVYLRCSFYEHPDSKIRIQLHFIPQPSGVISLSCVISSVTASGLRVVTDNLHIPFGGFYPQNWQVERRPMIRSVLRLLEVHQDRVDKTGDKVVPFEQLAFVDLENTQRELDRLNTELGFLLPYGEREEFGKISHEGRYRVWKEVWMLEYLGRSSRYY